MKIRNVVISGSVKDFSNLFFSNLVQKLFGLIREPVVAFFFGSSLLYANYLLIRVIADFFSQFTVGNALKANLLPKFTKIFESHKNISLKSVAFFSKRIMIILFCISLIIQFLVIWLLDSSDYLILIFLAVLLSITICFNFLNTIYLTILQSQGKFFDFSIATTLNSFFVAIFIFPLTYLIGIFGLVFSRIIGILSITLRYVVPMNKNYVGHEVYLSKSDFNISTLILGNFANIIILSASLVSGLDGKESITYFTYSVFILNALLTSVVGNISTLLLRSVSIKKSNLFMLYSLFISVSVGIFLIIGLQFYSEQLIELVFMRGEFTRLDVQITSIFIKKLSYAFIFIFISTTMFQPFFSLPLDTSNKIRKYLSFFFLTTIVISFIIAVFLDLDVKDESLIMIYSSSIMSVFLSVYSYFYYLKYNK